MPRKKVKEYLIAHESNHKPKSPSVGAVHQVQLPGKTEHDALALLEELYPDRTPTVVAEKVVG